jgi:hypothetical protein
MLARHRSASGSLPSWNDPGVCNVRRPPYEAKGDGVADDYAALQKCIDEQEVIFLPKGAYRISKTLEFRPNTKMIGLSGAYCLIAPIAVDGGDFTNPFAPKPAIEFPPCDRSSIMLAFVSIYTPTMIAPGSYALLWQSGPGTEVRSVFPFCYFAEDVMIENYIHPWDDWTWEQLPFDPGAPGKKSHEARSAINSAAGLRRNWPMTLLTGKAGGRMLGYYCNSRVNHGFGYRGLSISNCPGPLEIYHLHQQYSEGEYECEIIGASQVSIYGVKNEGSGTFLIQKSDNVLLANLGGTPQAEAQHAKIRLVDCHNTRIVNCADDYHANKEQNLPNRVHWIEDRSGTNLVRSPFFERPVLYLRNSRAEDTAHR